MLPGAKCSAFRLNLSEVKWPSRIFRIFVALVLPVTAVLRSLDLFLTYQALHLGGRELNPVSVIVLKHAGFPGLILLHVALIVGAVVGVWLLYGIAIRFRRMGEEGRTAYYLLEAFLIVTLLWLWINLTSVVIHNYGAIFGG